MCRTTGETITDLQLQRPDTLLLGRRCFLRSIDSVGQQPFGTNLARNAGVAILMGLEFGEITPDAKTLMTDHINRCVSRYFKAADYT